MAVTLHTLEEEDTYTRLRFCACCPLTPQQGPGGAHVTGSKARLRRVLAHVGDNEWSGPDPRGSALPGGGRLLRSHGAA
eukprot:COSAG01_NODE_48950_length_376_cov_1.115523_1_plen_78_part_10